MINIKINYLTYNLKFQFNFLTINSNTNEIDENHLNYKTNFIDQIFFLFSYLRKKDKNPRRENVERINLYIF